MHNNVPQVKIWFNGKGHLLKIQVLRFDLTHVFGMKYHFLKCKLPHIETLRKKICMFNRCSPIFGHSNSHELGGLVGVVIMTKILALNLTMK